MLPDRAKASCKCRNSFDAVSSRTSRLRTQQWDTGRHRSDRRFAAILEDCSCVRYWPIADMHDPTTRQERSCSSDGDISQATTVRFSNLPRRPPTLSRVRLPIPPNRELSAGLPLRGETVSVRQRIEGFAEEAMPPCRQSWPYCWESCGTWFGNMGYSVLVHRG